MNQKCTSCPFVTPLFDMSKLTPREKEVMVLMCTGNINKEIASKLFLSVKTVEKHRQQLYRKTGIRDAVVMTHFAIMRGVVTNLFAQEPTQ